MDLRVEGTCNTNRYCRPPWLVDKEKILFYAKNHWGEGRGGEVQGVRLLGLPVVSGQKFFLRLHYHTSCSYRVHKSCFYRVFNLQKLMQNDSRTSGSSSNYCTTFWEYKSRNKSRKNESMKPWLKRRRNFGFFETLLAEVRLEDVIEL